MMRNLTVFCAPTLALMLLPSVAPAQTAWAYDPAPEGSAIAALLSQAEAECAADADGAPVKVEITPAALTWTDLDGDEEADDAVVDFNGIYCSLSASLWQGTGGAPVHFILDAAGRDGASAVFQGWGPKVIEFQGSPLVLLGLHGSYCDATGVELCTLALHMTAQGPRLLTPVVEGEGGE